MQPALLIIDVQQALCHGTYAAFEAEALIQRINAVARRARTAAVPVIFIQHASIGGPLAHDTVGWQLAEGLEVLPADLRIHKAATDSFHLTELQSELQRLGVDHLVICGLQSEFCVDTTTRRALGLGYPVTLIEDGHSTMDNAVLSAAQISRHHSLTLADIDSFGVKVDLVAARDMAFTS